MLAKADILIVGLQVLLFASRNPPRPSTLAQLNPRQLGPKALVGVLPAGEGLSTCGASIRNLLKVVLREGDRLLRGSSLCQCTMRADGPQGKER